MAQQLIARLEDTATGEIIDQAFHAPIPSDQRDRAAAACEAIGHPHRALPLSNAATPVTNSATDQLLNRSWRPQLTITGIDGLPDVANAAAVMWPSLTLKLSLRLPPTLDAAQASLRLKMLLEEDPPYSCDVDFSVDMVSQGSEAPTLSANLAEHLAAASHLFFGKTAASLGGGGGIPFLAMLGERFAGSEFIVTGVLGPESNAHGPNEFLHLPTAHKLTTALAYILHNMEDR